MLSFVQYHCGALWLSIHSQIKIHDETDESKKEKKRKTHPNYAESAKDRVKVGDRGQRERERERGENAK